MYPASKPDADLRLQDKTSPHLLYSDRDQAFSEGDWTSLCKSSDAEIAWRAITAQCAAPVVSPGEELMVMVIVGGAA